MIRDRRIPINIITGFLGSGKTTLLNYWVKQPAMKDCAVLINEFGSVGIDHQLVRQVDNQVVLLESGCICCTLQNSLVNALSDLLSKALRKEIPPFSRVLIETTGMADPGSLVGLIEYEPFISQRFRFDGTVTVVDGLNIRKQIKAQYEAVKQIALADLVLISKSDLVDDEEYEEIEKVISMLNPSVRVCKVLNGEQDPAILSEIGPYNSGVDRDPKKINAWLATESASLGVASSVQPVKVSRVGMGAAKKQAISVHSNVATFSMEFDEPLDADRIIRALEAVRMQYGDSLLRLKGILNLNVDPRPVVVHGVYGTISPLTTLDSWPDDRRCSRIVFIVRAMVREQIESLFRGVLLGDPAFSSFLEPEEANI